MTKTMHGTRILGLLLLLSVTLTANAKSLEEGAHAAEPGFNLVYILWAFSLGALAAIALPIGAMAAVFWKPRPGVTAALTAFGAGALLAALSVEIVAPPAMAVLNSHSGAGGESVAPGGSALAALITVIVGSMVGGIIFVVLDQVVSAHGGYLRKTATTITHLSQRKKQRTKRMLERMGRVEFLRRIPPEHVQMLVDYVRPVTFGAEERLFNQGDRGDRMYFIEQGEIALSKDGREFKALGAGDVLGEIALLTGAPRTARAVARRQTVAIEVLKEDFDRIRKASPEFEAATTQLASQRLDELRQQEEVTGRAAAEWAELAANALRTGTALPTPQEVRLAASEHKSAALAIWLGTFLDGISESFVIGTSFLALVAAKAAQGLPAFVEVVPYTFMAALFLSNFPEALSSSAGMKEQGWKASNIVGLWFALVLLTAVGASLGYAIGSGVSHSVVLTIEGIAAGAMLTMVAQAMIPEAVHMGGPSIVGISTLVGFLSAVAFKILEA
ncbi:MAG TPA: Crp/Fnr family transcriptional regulator [Candidatus Acidoferrales bacterium]|nr:Crp/Fnr family transcriptional regulator [Candidatus Acidoferrales bacterium]